MRRSPLPRIAAPVAAVVAALVLATIVPLPFAAPEQALYLHWHEAADRDPANAWLRDRVRASLLEPGE